MNKENDFYYKKDRINQLRGFCTTVQNKCSAAEAARKLNIEPATVGKQIKGLERNLNIKLFDRSTPNKLVITKEGEKFFEEAIVHLHGIDGLFNSYSSEYDEKKKNTIKIAGNYSFLSAKLPKYIKKLSEIEEFKNLNLEIMSIKNDDAFEALKKGEIDICFYALLNNFKMMPELKRYNIFDWSSVLLVHRDHPLANKKKITKSEIESYPFLFLDKYSFINPGQLLNLKASNITFKDGNWWLAVSFVKENLGMLIVLDEFAELYKDDPSLVAINIDNLLPKACFSYIVKKNYKNKEAVDFLIKEMVKDCNLKNCLGKKPK